MFVEMGNVFIYFSMIFHAIVAECSMGFPIIDGAFRNVNHHFYHLLPLVSVWLLIAMVTGCLGICVGVEEYNLHARKRYVWDGVMSSFRGVHSDLFI